MTKISDWHEYLRARLEINHVAQMIACAVEPSEELWVRMGELKERVIEYEGRLKNA